jgi:HAE1 family hydrophobic/amphiphilic exporter-1
VIAALATLQPARAQGTTDRPSAPSTPPAAAPSTPTPSPTPIAPPAARTSAFVPPTRVLALTRKEAIVRAITQSPDLASARVETEVAFAGIDRARGEFEPYGFLGANYAKNRDPTFSREIAPGVTFSGLPAGTQVNPSDVLSWNGGARVKTELGTGIELRYELSKRTTDNVFALDPTITPAFVAEVSQPLLKGFGLDINRAFITVARLGHEASVEGYQDAALSVALGVEDAYWLFAAALENQKVAEQTLVTAKELLKNVRERRDAGTVADIEVFSAEAGVASREEQLIRAKNTVMNAQDQLLRLILPPQALVEWDVTVVPLDQPRLDESITDIVQLIETAFERRPDLHAAALQTDIETVQIERARNDALPTLNLVGSWAQLGLGDGHHDSHEELLSGRFYDWSIGLSFEYPLFNIGPSAAAREAEARRRRALRRRDVLEQDIVLEVRTAAREIETNRERIRAAGYSVELARKQLKAAQDRLDNGLATSFDVLQKEEDLTSARVVEISARIDYVRARARLARATGVLLEQYDIEVE